MAKFIFITDQEDNRECSKIEFDVPDDMNIWEYGLVCRRMASALGYQEGSIKKVFSSSQPDTKEDLKFKKFLSENYTITGSILNL